MSGKHHQRTTGERAHAKLWTDEETGDLLIGHENGLSFAQIANKLPNRTRGMVAGKANRLGLCKAKGH